MAVAGRKALVKVSGAGVAMTNEATTNVGGDNMTYRVTNTARRIWSRTGAITVRVGGNVVTAGFTINRLTGTITFTTAATRTVTVSGDYLPVATVAEAHEYTYTLTAANEADNAFGDTFVTRVQTQKDISGSLSVWRTIDATFETALLSGSPVVLEFYSDGSQAFDLRAWALLNQNEIAAAVDGLVDQAVSFEGVQDADNRVVA